MAYSDLVIGVVAERQHGVVSRRQLLDRGLGRLAIDRRIGQGRLRVVHQGVYAVGHPHLTTDGRWMAAALACGPDAVLSHRAAAALWLLRRSSRIDVIAPTARRRPALTLHRNLVAEDEVTEVRGIPVTTVPRTLLDLAAVLPAHQVERAINEAEIQRLTDPLSLPALLARYPGRRGVRTLRAILGEGTRRTRSELEARFLAFLRRAGLPLPEANAHLLVGGALIECDCVWRDRRLVVELDGHATHGTAAAFERDRARDRSLHVHGWRTVRVTWRQLSDEPEALAVDLRALLRRATPLDFVTQP
jgi:very-short-patch-repair endonuclease